MKILSYKPGHDGTCALIHNGKLIFSREAEKDSGQRYGQLSPSHVLESIELAGDDIDVLCISGFNFRARRSPRYDYGYEHKEVTSYHLSHTKILGRPVQIFSSSHEASHLFSAAALPSIRFPSDLYILLYEGRIGRFYEVNSGGKIVRLPDVVSSPGTKYEFLYFLGDNSGALASDSLTFPGKLMALAAYGRREAQGNERDLINYILDSFIWGKTKKASFKDSEFYEIGVESQAFKDLAKAFSDELFDRFARFAFQALRPGLPLLIVGGCGINCDWNSRWVNLGFFSNIFVPPCANDSGSAIGTAVHAQYILTGTCDLDWDAYRGEEFISDVDLFSLTEQFIIMENSPALIATKLKGGSVLAFAHGRYELGPRALGNRSIIAEATSESTRQRLNEIKERESYRPVAPVCRVEDAAEHFEIPFESPHMLYTFRVRDQRLKAITHVDGTARVQTVTSSQNHYLWNILKCMKEVSGIGVLCNTSLNFKGHGFINHLSDLVSFVIERGVDGIVLDKLFLEKRH